MHTDLVIRKFAAWQKAIAYHPKAAKRAQRCADKAVIATGHALLAAGVRGPEGVQCHVRRALWLRSQQEEEAAMRKDPVYRPMAGLELRFPAEDRELYADINSGPAVAPTLNKALHWLDAQRPGTVALLRQALTAVQRRPSPRHDNWEVERHLELVVVHLTTPRAAKVSGSKRRQGKKRATNDNSPQTGRLTVVSDS